MFDKIDRVRLVTCASDEAFFEYAKRLPVHKRLVLEGVRGAIDSYVGAKGFQLIGAGAEAVALRSHNRSNESEVLKIFLPGRGRYETLARDSELIQRKLGFIAVPTVTERARISGFSIPLQRQPYVTPHLGVSSIEDRGLSGQSHDDLIKMINVSRELERQEGRWLDISPANYSILPDGVHFFDMSLFDPGKRVEYVATSRAFHNQVSEVIESAVRA